MRALQMLAVLLVLALALGGCGRKSFPDGDIRSLEGVYYGTVLDVTDVMVAEDPALTGPIAGGVVGAIVGSQIGGLFSSDLISSNVSDLVLTAAGIVIGVEMGSKVQTRRYRATQITMELNNGKILVVVQGSDDYFLKGDKVRILHMGEGRARVQHI